MTSTANKADCIGVIGASGTGKGVFCTARVKPFIGRRQVLVWSPLELTDQYARKLGGVVARSIPAFVAKVRARVRCIVFVPSDVPKVMAGQFDLFCRVAWHVPLGVVLVEELSRVTRASWAPAPWRNLSTAGRHRGLTVIGTAQRPSQIDKDFLGNCTEVRAYRVNYDDDARNLAASLREPWADFMDLADLHYIHRFMRERRNERGVQPLPGQQRRALAAPAAKALPAPAVEFTPFTDVKTKAKRGTRARAPRATA